MQKTGKTLINEYLLDRKSKRYRASTLSTYKKVLESVERALKAGGSTLIEAEPKHLASICYNAVSVTTGRMKASIVSGFRSFHGSPINKQYLNRIVRESDRDPIAAPLPGKVSEMYDLDTTPINLLLFSLLVETGARIGSAVKLRHSDVNVELGLITFKDAKGGKNIVAKMSSRLRDIYVTAVEKSPLKNVSAKIFDFGENYGYRIIKSMGQKVGIKLAPHALRKYFAVKRYYETKDIVGVQKALGHSNAMTTSNYITRDYEYYTAAIEAA